ncbi:hypothetical protein T09_2843 [Trichinella sp. T9]|nr:hypothetical protein T09_2843 [Trichinella sp. T9]
MQYSIQVLYLVNLRTGPQLWVGAPGKIPYSRSIRNQNRTFIELPLWLIRWLHSLVICVIEYPVAAIQLLPGSSVFKITEDSEGSFIPESVNPDRTGKMSGVHVSISINDLYWTLGAPQMHILQRSVFAHHNNELRLHYPPELPSAVVWLTLYSIFGGVHVSISISDLYWTLGAPQRYDEYSGVHVSTSITDLYWALGAPLNFACGVA